MSKGKVYEYCLVYHPPKEDGVEQKASEMISDGIQLIMAPSSEVAQMKAVRSIPEEYVEKLDHVDVVLRAF